MENRRKRWYDLFGLLPRNLGRLLLWLGLIPIAFIIVLLVYAWRADQYELDEVLAPLENCAAYDRNGQWIGTLTDHDRVYVARNELPDNLVNAFIAREDEAFFDHGGIVYSSIIRSICRNLTTLSYAQGASTITMQLARNCYELGGKTLDRKVLEMAVARRIEGKYSKDEILTAYLNRIYFGQQCYGIAQAADLYFGKKVADSPVWAGLPRRVDNQLKNCVQAAVLCVDSRKGDLLAVTGGRSALDGVDRWQTMVMPGDLFTPVVNLCAVDQRRTVIRSSPEVTGRGVGFNTVIETAQKAGYKGDLPRSPDLYAGRFRAPLSHAVNALYLIGNDGRNVQISSVRQVGTTKKNLVMVNAPSLEESRREILPRESAHLVAALPPFRYDERSRKTSVNVRLPENTGHFSAVMGRYFTVFVWVGFDEPDEAVYKKKGVASALAKTSAALAGEVYDRAEENRRKAVRERREKEAPAEQDT